MSDNLTPEQRSYCMSRVKGKDTRIEKLIRSELVRRGLRFRKHLAALPGKPDIVFAKTRVAVFIDGDFWHGYRFPLWAHQLSGFWRIKIGKTRERDRRNFRRLRSMGWRVVRLWQHEIENDFQRSLSRITRAIEDESRDRDTRLFPNPQRHA
jgi:DNA mismatch endonuclease (patch repair protein)